MKVSKLIEEIENVLVESNGFMSKNELQVWADQWEAKSAGAEDRVEQAKKRGENKEKIADLERLSDIEYILFEVAYAWVETRPNVQKNKNIYAYLYAWLEKKENRKWKNMINKAAKLDNGKAIKGSADFANLYLGQRPEHS